MTRMIDMPDNADEVARNRDALTDKLCANGMITSPVVEAAFRRFDGVLATGRTDVWSEVTIGHGSSFADLHLWFAGSLPGFCQLAVDEGTALAQDRKSWFPFGVARGDSFAYLAVRPALAGAGIERTNPLRRWAAPTGIGLVSPECGIEILDARSLAHEAADANAAVDTSVRDDR